jgi:hypothetical protein
MIVPRWRTRRTGGPLRRAPTPINRDVGLQGTAVGEENRTAAPSNRFFETYEGPSIRVNLTDEAVFLPTTVYGPSHPQAVLLV